MEIWKITSISDCYEVSNLGRVRSKARYVICGPNQKGKKFVPEKILTTWCCKKTGYLQCGIHRKKYNVHRLVAFAFLGNPTTDKHQVNHKDGDRKNSNLENLEWVLPTDNVKHGFEFNNRQNPFLGKFGKDHPVSRPIKAVHSETRLRLTFPSGMDAIRLGYAKNSGSLTRACQKKYKTHNGYIWSYL